MKELKLNPKQIEAINADKNSVVSAGAGSGKTTVLSERFSRLVLEKKFGVDEILTLTFTKKATVEMSSRIYKTLEENAPDKAADFYKANIRTLDGYCNYVAKMGAHLYGISPDFAQDDSIIDQIKQSALPFLLEHRNNPAIKEMVKTKSFDNIASELLVNPVISISTVAEPIDYKKCLINQSIAISKAWNDYSIKAAEEVEHLHSEFMELQGNSAKFMDKLTEIFDEEVIPVSPELTVDQVMKGDYSKILKFQKYLDNFSSGNLSLPGGKSTTYNTAKEFVYLIREQNEILRSIVNFVYGIPFIYDLLPLLEEFQEKANNLKRSTGRLSFKDISNLATCILRDYPDIRQVEKEKYKAIMIDEFQDNNEDQKDLLFMLSERLDRHEPGIPAVEDLCPDKLFFVGDEKQSIYIFRGADVSVFRGLSKDFSEGNISMSANHRSSQALIGAFNTIFGGIPYPYGTQSKAHCPSVFFSEDAGTGTQAPDYEPVYSKVTLSKKAEEEIKNCDSLEKIYAPKIHFALYEKGQEAKPLQLVEEEAEAEWVARKIKDLITGSQDRPAVKPEDIAILIRTYGCQPLYERTLLNHGIPYNSETLTGFFSDGPVNDIFAMLRICVYETDTLSYAQILRSPFVNLSVEETNGIMVLNHSPFAAEPSSVLCEESLERYNHAKEFYEELKKEGKTAPLTQLVTKIWYKFGYGYETKWNNTVKLYEKLYDYIFELARQGEEDCMSLAAFVDSLRSYQDLSSKMDGMDIPMKNVEGVHILTIHKSKGLEYPIVFLVHTQSGSMNDSNASPVFASKNYGITINTPTYPGYGEKSINFFYNQTKELEGKKSDAELRRVVYVALTRAEEELYITNGRYSKTDDAISKYASGHSVKSIFHVLEPSINYYLDHPDYFSPFTVESIHPYDRFNERTSAERKNTEKEKNSFIKDVQTQQFYSQDKIIPEEKIEDKYIRPSKLHQTDDETTPYIKVEENESTIPYFEINQIVKASIPSSERSKENPSPRFNFTHFGSIAHAYLEAAVKNESPNIPTKYFLGLENNHKNEKIVRSICEEMAAKFLKSKIGQEAFNSDFHKAEYDFRSRVCNKIIRGQIDLLYRTNEGKYVIVDYKTNISICPELYYNQLACYRQAVASMMNVENPEEIKCYLYYLRFGQLVDITSECSKVDIEKAVLEIDDFLDKE